MVFIEKKQTNPMQINLPWAFAFTTKQIVHSKDNIIVIVENAHNSFQKCHPMNAPQPSVI